MTDNEILEGNKLIAEFMEYERDEYEEFNESITYSCDKLINISDDEDWETSIDDWTNWLRPDEMLFHSSWDWLMPVITNILEICSELDELERYHVIIDQIPQIHHTHSSVVEFIKWYNE